MKYIEDKQNNEQSRIEACFSLGWVATDDQMKEVAKKVKEFDKPDPKSSSFAAATSRRSSASRCPRRRRGSSISSTARSTSRSSTRRRARSASAASTPAITAQLFEKLKNPATRTDAALAHPPRRRRRLRPPHARARTTTSTRRELEELKVVYNQTFGYWSDKNYENGDVARWIDNAYAASRVKVSDALQDWPKLILSRAIQGIDYDNGPHSVTRVQMRVRLLRDARGADEKKRRRPIQILKFMGEKGVLMALKAEPGPVAGARASGVLRADEPEGVDRVAPEAKDAKARRRRINVVPPK